MGVKVFKQSLNAFVDVPALMMYSGNAFKQAYGKVYVNNAWKDVISYFEPVTTSNMPVGTIVTLEGTKTTANQPIKAVVLSNNGTTAVMCSYGFGHGSWPGSGTLSASTYSTTTGSFSISNITLPTGTSNSNLAANGVTNQSSLIRTALTSAAGVWYLIGAQGSASWLGTPYEGSGAYAVSSSSNVYTSTNQNGNLVVAPAFNLALSGVKINIATKVLKK